MKWIKEVETSKSFFKTDSISIIKKFLFCKKWFFETRDNFGYTVIMHSKGNTDDFKKCGLWPSLDLRLSYEKQKYFSYQAIINYRLYVKEKQCEPYIKLKEHNNKCDKSCICDEYICYKNRCQCV